jgi:DNA polymerase-1
LIETALLDGDIIGYRNAAAYANEDENLARWQTGEMVRRILHETNAMGFVCFLSGSSNFRYDIYPEYKANRRDVPKPRHLATIREYLVTEWDAKVTDGIEADDAMGIEQVAIDGSSVICSIDKDMLQIPGQHYNFVKKEFKLVSPLDGVRHFYYQLIMGDKADNIFGYDGKARDKVPQFLRPDIEALQVYTEEWEMFSHVRDLYDDDERLLMNGQVLKIQQREGELWSFPAERMDGSEA